MEDVDILLEEIIDITKKAGKRTLDFFQHEFNVDYKEDNSPVTDADMASNDVLVKELSKYNIPILSEEMTPPENQKGDFLWIIDPLDGTRSFVKGKDDYSVMVGLVYKGKPILGIVYQPSVDVLYYAEKGKGSYVKKGEKIEKLCLVERCELSNVKIVVSRRAEKKESFIKKIQEMKPKEVHYLSSNGVKLGRIAEGKYDLFFNPSGKLGQWDYCAPHIIFEEAGGIITYLDGKEVLYGNDWDNNSRGVIATNKKLHPKALSFFR